MLVIPSDVASRYDAILHEAKVSAGHFIFYRKWLRYYLDFCAKYSLDPSDGHSWPRFDRKLKDKNQAEWMRRQARHAVSLYWKMYAQPDSESPPVSPNHGDNSRGIKRSDRAPRAAVEPADNRRRRERHLPGVRPYSYSATAEQECDGLSVAEPPAMGNAGVVPVHPPSRRSCATAPARNERTALNPPSTRISWVWVYDKLGSTIQVRHYSPKTLRSYRGWVRKLQTFTKSKDPRTLSMEDVRDFLSFLAVEQHVSASTQNQAFNALLFLFRHVLEKDFEMVEGVVRAKKKPYIPVVLSREEVDRVISHLAPPYDLVVKLLYGCGLRLFEALQLRVQDVNFELKVLTVHDGKGKKDRTVPLPSTVIPQLNEQLSRVKEVHRSDLKGGYDGTFLPSRLGTKYKGAARDLVWQWFFPAIALTRVSRTQEWRRYHLHETHVQRAIKDAVRAAQIPKRVSSHCFRHSFASDLLQTNDDIRTIQEMLGHSDLKTTMIYTHTVPSTTLKDPKSPLDLEL